MPKSANEVFRDHVRFTGDGLPNEPGPGHGLPFGDPRTGVHNPGKSDLRDWAVGVDESADRAEAAAEVLEQVSDAIDAISGPADARKRFVVNAAGTGYELADRPKQLIAAYSQSNIARTESVAWRQTPPDNLFVWNGGNWNGDITPPAGNAFVRAGTRNPQLAIAYAAEIARENPETDFYLVMVGRGGTGVRALAGMRYVFDSATTGAPASGDLRFNAGNSAIAYNETDLTNFPRFLGDTDLGVGGMYPARIETALNGGTSWIEFTPTAAATDNGTWRSQPVTVTGSAQWPPQDGAEVTVFPAAPRMRTFILPVIQAAMTAMGLTGAARKIDKLLIWPTEADLNYTAAYEGRDFDFILTYLSPVITPDTSILMTLPWPYATGISDVRGFWWDTIRRIVSQDTDQRTLVTLSNTGAQNWGDTNNVHVVGAGLEIVGTYLRKSEVTGGADAQVVRSGLYIPAAVGVTNAGGITPSEAMWTQVGPVVTVSGVISVTPTASGVVTDVRIPLPVPSNIQAAHYLAGTGASSNRANNAVAFIGDPPSNSALMTFTSVSVLGTAISYSFSYRIRG